MNELLQQAFVQIGVMTQAIAQLNHDYTELASNHAEMAANIDWLTKFFWVVVTATVGSFVATVWQLVIAKKNGRDK